VRVAVGELVDLSKLGAPGREPTPREIREALPPGWALEDDGRTARSDLRLLFRRGWVLAIGMLCFGAAGAGLFWWSAPRGNAEWWRFGAAIGILVVAGGLVGPMVARALARRA
jgi:hypothetical protein